MKIRYLFNSMQSSDGTSRRVPGSAPASQPGASAVSLTDAEKNKDTKPDCSC